MSGIPPDIVGSAAQAGFAAKEASRQRDADRVSQEGLAARQARAVDDAAESVETGDADTAVFADAEGAGGQGRAFSDDSEADAEDVANAADADDTDGDPSARLDIEA